MERVIKNYSDSDREMPEKFSEPQKVCLFNQMKLIDTSALVMESFLINPIFDNHSSRGSNECEECIVQITTSSTLNQVLVMKIRKHIELNRNTIRKKLKMMLYDYKFCFCQMIRKKTEVKVMEGQKRLPPSKQN